MSSIKKRFSSADNERMVAAIRSAESVTSAEIRVYFEGKCTKEPIKRALEVFKKLKMDKTAAANGVLIYVALDSHKAAILGDKAVNDIAPEGFWDDTYKAMREYFIQNDAVSAVVKGTEIIGEKLKGHFPIQKDDINELPNEIAFNS